MKNSITNWKSFVLGEICVLEKEKPNMQVPTGASVSYKDLNEGTTPRITVTNENNGIMGYYSSSHKNYRVYENFISVSFLSTVFYHPYAASLDMKVHCLKFKNIELTLNIGLFLVSVIRTTLQNFSYADQISSKVLPTIMIKLPSDSVGNPDFAYMEEYMKDIFEKTRQKLLKQQKINPAKTFINVNDWKDFHLYDLFVIDSGTSLDKVKMGTNNPEINFVGRANANRGISCQVNKLPGIEPYESGTLTLSLGGAYLGSCFVQEKPFYTSQNVFVLIPKTNMSRMAKDFIATMIFKESQIHYKAFIDELNRHIKRDFVIKLPVNSEGNPDFAYMESYMKGVMEKQRANLDVLQMLLIGR